MKILFPAILLWAFDSIFGADGPAFGNRFSILQTTNIEIAWAVPTNNRPPALWVYKVIPQKFSDSCLSNLMTLGPFTSRDRMELSAADSDFDASSIVYAKQSRFLTIAPANGWIKYRDNEAESLTRVEEVPNDHQVEELGLLLLSKMAINLSELVRKPHSTNLLTFAEVRNRGRLEKAAGKTVEDISARGVYFLRKIDGISIAGIGSGGGFHVIFGSHGTIVAFELIWRNLQPYQHRKAATCDQILRFIREGKAVMTHRNIVAPHQIRNLSITEIAPFYMGASWMDRQDFVYPFAQLEAVVEDLSGKQSPLQLYCPITSE
jgi:hypothetical protein